MRAKVPARSARDSAAPRLRASAGRMRVQQALNESNAYSRNHRSQFRFAEYRLVLEGIEKRLQRVRVHGVVLRVKIFVGCVQDKERSPVLSGSGQAALPL